MAKALAEARFVHGKVRALLDHDGETACRDCRASWAVKHRLAVKLRIEYAEKIGDAASPSVGAHHAPRCHLLHLTDG